jgi:hypothetical protein
VRPQNFALYGGMVMLVIGMLSLMPALSVAPYQGLPYIRIDYAYGIFLSFFPMNILNKITLMVFGVAGILVSKEAIGSFAASVKYSRAILFVMGIFVVLGIFPSTYTLFGFSPLFGGDVFIHSIFAILGGYFGYGFSYGSSSKSLPR